MTAELESTSPNKKLARRSRKSDQGTQGAQGSRRRTRRSGFVGILYELNRWRLSRPFWGGLILLIGGYLVMNPMLGASFQLIVHLGIGGASPIILGGGMMVAAVIAVLMPSQRYFTAIMAMFFSVLSLPFANLGGWVIGMVLGIVGSGMVFAWAPYTDKQLAEFAGREKIRQERRQAKKAAKTLRSN